jgi:large subunit ribosomal protein L3
MRSGLIAQKLGMTRYYRENGEHVPVTVLRLDKCEVVDVKTQSRDGYTALQLGYGTRKANSTTQPLRGHFAKAKVEPKKKLAEFRVSEDAVVEIGSEFSVTHFVSGQMVDVSATSIGKGFAGGMKRHNFHGLRASHGVSLTHRSIGSTGNRTEPGRVFKNTKMPGRMGNERVTVQNLEVVHVCEDKEVILVKGGIPGHEGSYVLIRDAIKKKMPDNAPYPAGLKAAKNTKDVAPEAAEQQAEQPTEQNEE